MKLLTASILFSLLFTAFPAELNSQTLKDAFKDYFLIGCAISDFQAAGKEPKALEIAAEQFNTITPENMLKWERVHPEPDRFDFELPDRLVEFGQKNGMFIVGHTLVWHNQTPDWVFKDDNGNYLNREQLLARLKEHIYTVVGRYKGKIKGWDVVNEAVDEDGSLRKTKWLEIIGEDYIEKAFEFAREADPDAELYYNDFNTWHKAKREGIMRLIKNLLDKGIKIDGIGLQGHWGLDYPALDELDESLKEYSSTGLKIMITELDINILPTPNNYTGAEITTNFELQKKYNPYPDGLPDSMQTVLAERYAELFGKFLKYRDSISRVTFWGIHDGHSWLNNWPIRGRTSYPLLFDRELKPKPAFNAVIKTVNEIKCN
ncbi:family 10 endo-beta-xylanase [Melioribacter roseus P3M-2]|jgi:endo-1,4-beta-xylanase|uniref:Beta-xylanase n=1 Tax=Melioribacter roseus (strain DSM 23840 / JCM 17771 / VKM B-2668 / P3M-2) TaxID=1191523 RepID=I6Z9A7_MELRP|nr:endo-1,4-beta-xylanase [Melioribacter roseus]AFN75725.1 family 10 endo-beta-xylanase [Melioribacter roseus P3M-2]